MIGKDQTRPNDDQDLDDTVERQMSTSGMTDVVKTLRKDAGDKKAETAKAEDDES